MGTLDKNMLDFQAEQLAAKTLHYLITTMGCTSEDANADELYRAFSYALREEIMINWQATGLTFKKNNCRTLYYLSMEYLPGRIFTNNITNLQSQEIVQMAMNKLNRNFGEIALCESDPGLGNGGLGRLASCFLDSLATLHYPVIAYGLRYQYGIFEQQLWDGVQIEAPDCWLLNENPWEFRRDLGKNIVKFCGESIPSTNLHGDEILNLANFEEVWALPYDLPIVGYAKDRKFSVLTLRLWTTKESPRNFQLQQYNAGRLDQAAENTLLTDVLYPNDHHDAGKRIRLKQEFLLVSASLQDIIRHYLSTHNNFRSFGDKVRIQINDTHPALVIPELIRILTKHHDLPWNMAVELTRTCTGYTNHTILSEALEQWDYPLFSYLLPRQYRIIERLNLEFCTEIRAKYPHDEEKVQRLSIIEKGRLRMANLSIYGSHSINGVAALHSEILKKSVFKDFFELYPERFFNVTNGVTQRRWLLHCNPDLAHFITKRIGDGWITEFSQISKLAPFAADSESQQEFHAIKRKNKQRLIEALYHDNKLRNSHGEIDTPSPVIDIHSLFDVQIKRIHEYKRQLLNALHLILLYQEILSNKDHNRIKRTVIIGGKAAAGYETAKETIRLIHCVARKINRDPAVQGFLKIIYIENYNVSKAELIIPAADLSEQISTAGMEASGTGNMKFAMNGALTIGTDDGANIEMKEAITTQWWPFTFGATVEEIDQVKRSGDYSPKKIAEADKKIQDAVDTLRNRTFALTDDEHYAFSNLYHKLLEGHYGGTPDRYFTLLDIEDYYQVQKKVEALYAQPNLWAEYAIHNIAGMGMFSTDRSIEEYSSKIWGIHPQPIDNELLEKIRSEYSAHDRCRIF